MDLDKRNTLRLLGGALAAPFVSHLFASPALGQTANQPEADLVKYGNKNHIAFVPTQDNRLDVTINRGLQTLVDYVNDNTSLEISPNVVKLDLENDELGYFPFIYWPVSSSDGPLSDNPDLQRKLQEHLDRRNVVMFDVLDFGRPVEDILREYLGDVNLGLLSPLPEQHTLTRSFFLTSGIPGSQTTEPVYIQTPNPNNPEDVTSVIIGRSNWSRAVSGFAHDVGSDEFRQVWHGLVNSVIYAYTGDYKGDLFQVQQIMDRL